MLASRITPREIMHCLQQRLFKPALNGWVQMMPAKEEIKGGKVEEKGMENRDQKFLI